MKTELFHRLFSRYRNELIGIATIGVLVAHAIALSGVEISNIWVKIIAFVPRLAFTQGFLFLSGFGLYYSFAKNDNIKEFYLRRLKRLLIPFVILSAWYYIFHDFIETFDPVRFLLHISSFAFWIDGNYNGMWYIAMSVFLYALFPFLYKHISRSEGGKATVMFILTFIALIFLVAIIAPAYYDKVSIGINKIPIFITGIYAGKLSLFEMKKESIVFLCLTGVFWMISFFLKSHFEYAVEIYTMTEKIVYMFAICILLLVSENLAFVKWICKMLKWFGRYSLELYVLHLLVFGFLSSEMLFGNISPAVKVWIMVVGALLLCVPFHKLTDVIVRKINLK